MEGRIVSISERYGYSQMIDDLNKMQQNFPFIHVTNIGMSVLGKPIPAVRIGTGEKWIHVNGAFHANEWITSLIIMSFLEDYADAILNGKPLSDQSGLELSRQATLFVVPMVNPDGVELVHNGVQKDHPFFESLLLWNRGSTDFSHWKANIRGVDLNDQFPAHWEVEKERRSPDAPGPQDYVGKAPLIEPESLAMAQFTLLHPFHLVIALHTQGREIYWNYRDYEPVNSRAIAEEFAKISGYEAVQLFDSDAGYKDWFIEKFRRPGFTVEAGLGVNPLPIGQFPQIYKEVFPILIRALSIMD